MNAIYLDSNVLFRLADHPSWAEALGLLQQHHVTNVVLGWTTIWELAGAFAAGPGAVEGARADVALVRRLVEHGARIAKSPWNVAQEALRLAPTARWHDRGVLARDSAEFSDAMATVDAIGDPAHDGRTREWYARNVELANGFKEAESKFRERIRARSTEGKPSIVVGLTESLNALEAEGWLPAATARLAERLGMRRAPSRRVTSDTFGPLGRIMRASIGLSMLQATEPSAARVRPKYSDYADVMHIVAAGLVGRFVTGDKIAARVFRATWPTNSHSAMAFPADFELYVSSRIAELRARTLGGND